MSFLTLPTVLSVPAAPKPVSDSRLAEPLTSTARAIRTAVFLGLAVTGVGLDLASKHYIFAWRTWERFGAGHEWWILDNHFGVQTSVNPGALFGMGAGFTWAFVGLSFIALGAISYFIFVRPRMLDWWLTVALGLVTGGILGNLYDRLGFWRSAEVPGYVDWGVRDWILVRFQGVPFFDPWPNFNIADCCLVVGACLLAIHSLRPEPKQSPKSELESA